MNRKQTTSYVVLKGLQCTGGPPLTRKLLTRFALTRFLAYVRVSGGISVSRRLQYNPSRVSCNTVFSKPQKTRKAGTLCIEYLIYNQFSIFFEYCVKTLILTKSVLISNFFFQVGTCYSRRFVSSNFDSSSSILCCYTGLI